MGSIEEINIKNRTYYVLMGWSISKTKNFDPSLLKIDKKSYKNIDIYYIEYITIKKISDYVNILSVNPLYLIINGYIEEKKSK